MSRATFFDDSSYAAATRAEYERIGSQYCIAAHKAKTDDLEPDRSWLREHVQHLRESNGRSFAVRYVRAIGHHMRVNGKPNLCDADEIQEILYRQDPLDPLYQSAPADLAPRLRKRAQYFMDSAYTVVTHRGYRREISKCVASLPSQEISQLEGFTQEDVLEYLKLIAVRYSGHHVRNVRNALSHFFRSRNLPDVARARATDEFVRSVKGTNARPSPKPLTVEELHRIFACFGSGAIDIRDRVLLIVLALSRFTPETVASITVASCCREADGYVFSSEDPRRFGETFIGGCDDPDIDIRIWLPRLVELVGSGPLFQPVVRGAFIGQRMCTGTAFAALRRAGACSGVIGNLFSRFKVTFREAVLQTRGPAVLACHLGFNYTSKAALRTSEAGREALIESRRGRTKFARLDVLPSGSFTNEAHGCIEISS